MKIIGAYKNGNYRVIIFDDGTKIRSTINKEDNDFIPDRLESVDLKITNMCDMGCKFCHEKSEPDGKHADINLDIIDTFLPYTEVAIGGGNPLAHPELEGFLRHLKDLKCIPSMTVNQVHFLKDIDKIRALRDENLIYGLGISLKNPDADFAAKVSEFPNAVVHVIAGIADMKTFKKMQKQGIKKILILGYKIFGRGKDFYSQEVALNVKNLRANLREVVDMFDVVSFDNLAIKQLDVKFLLSEEEWEEFYMGDDGGYTMYIDLVNQEYARSSTSKERFPLLSTINEMFLDIRERSTT